MTWPEQVTNDDMQRALKLPITKAMVLVVLGSPEGGAMYKRDENGAWRKLDDKAYSTPWEVMV